MRVVEVSAVGPAEVLRPAERPDPEPGHGEVVVRIHAASINPTDLAARTVGTRYIPDLVMPFVPGWDLAGIVESVGDGVTTYAVGDRVCGMIPFGRIGGRVGAYAEAAAVRTDWLAPLDDRVSFEEGATLPLNALTAVQALDLLVMPRGSRLLITGASGGVGGFAVSLAARAGLHVIAVAGRDDADWVASLGATDVLRRDANLATIPAVDGVLDAVPLGPLVSTASLRPAATAVFTRQPTPATSDRFRFEVVHVQSDEPVLREMSRLLADGVLRRDANLATIPAVDGVLDAVPLGPLVSTASLRPAATAVFTRQPTPATSDRFRFEVVHVQSDEPVLREMSRLLADGVLRTRVARVLPLAEAAEGHRLVERGGLRGKVVLRP